MTIALILSVVTTIGLLIFASVQHRVIKELSNIIAKLLLENVTLTLKANSNQVANQALDDLNSIINGDETEELKCGECGKDCSFALNKPLKHFLTGSCPHCNSPFCPDDEEN